MELCDKNMERLNGVYVIRSTRNLDGLLANHYTGITSEAEPNEVRRIVAKFHLSVRGQKRWNPGRSSDRPHF